MTEASTFTKYKKGKLYPLNLSILVPDPLQPRKHIDDSDLEELKLSIQTHGLLSPIIFRIDQHNNLILVAGERRYRACQALGWTQIDGVFIDSPKHDEVALVDNVQREDLHAVDLAEALKSLKDKYNYTLEQIGHVIGKAEQTVSEIIKLTELSQEIRDDARTRKNLSRNALLKVARKSKKAQKKTYDMLVGALSKEGTKRSYVKHQAHEKVTTMADKAIKGIHELNLDNLGDNKEEVETKLRQLLAAIQDKLGTATG
ncbi:MAG: chromosome partitioning protein ParB [Clostridiales bacterium GWB2_37_7]|nr:MAG: chromosome partitioning protein ParB [Clostridiales bacterium GWB2_37_7]